MQEVVVQPAPVHPVPVPAVIHGIDWQVVLPIVIGGLGMLLGQVLTYLKSRENGRKSDALAGGMVSIGDTNASQNHKLQRIEVLVDGRYSEVLQELADLKRLLAIKSGSLTDHDNADRAQQRANEQHTRVREAHAVALPAADSDVHRKPGEPNGKEPI